MSRHILQQLTQADHILGQHIKKLGPYTLKPQRDHSLFESLLSAIVYQQLTGKAAQTILGRVLALYPRKKFPRPDDILKTCDDVLRGAGLSFAKIAAVKDLALKTKEGVVPTQKEIEKMSDDEIVEQLTVVRGIGRWTVEMMLIFKLGRPDILPIDDYGVRKGFAKVFQLKELPKPKELLAYGEKWRPHRTAAAWYLWRVVVEG
jgi:DNA-3-methyladenine glycosylase II